MSEDHPDLPGLGESLDQVRLTWLQAGTLFRLDPAGRLVAVNEAEPVELPLLHAAVDETGWSIWSHAELSPRLELDAMDLISQHHLGPDDELHPGHPLVAQLRALVRQAADDQLGVLEVHAGPAFVADPDLDLIYPDVEGLDVLLDKSESSVLIRHFPYSHHVFDSRVPVGVVVRDGAAVSACFSARSTLQAAEAGVATEPTHRRQGLAAAVVTAWITAQHDFGLVPLYSTSWANVGSRRLAAELGLRHYGSTINIVQPI